MLNLLFIHGRRTTRDKSLKLDSFLAISSSKNLFSNQLMSFLSDIFAFAKVYSSQEIFTSVLDNRSPNALISGFVGHRAEGFDGLLMTFLSFAS